MSPKKRAPEPPAGSNPPKRTRHDADDVDDAIEDDGEQDSDGDDQEVGGATNEVSQNKSSRKTVLVITPIFLERLLDRAFEKAISAGLSSGWDWFLTHVFAILLEFNARECDPATCTGKFDSESPRFTIYRDVVATHHGLSNGVATSKTGTWTIQIDFAAVSNGCPLPAGSAKVRRTFESEHLDSESRCVFTDFPRHLIVQALRTGQLEGATSYEALVDGFKDETTTLRWLHPTRPLVHAPPTCLNRGYTEPKSRKFIDLAIKDISQLIGLALAKPGYRLSFKGKRGNGRAIDIDLEIDIHVDDNPVKPHTRLTTKAEITAELIRQNKDPATATPKEKERAGRLVRRAHNDVHRAQVAAENDEVDGDQNDDAPTTDLHQLAKVRSGVVDGSLVLDELICDSDSLAAFFNFISRVNDVSPPHKLERRNNVVLNIQATEAAVKHTSTDIAEFRSLLCALCGRACVDWITLERHVFSCAEKHSMTDLQDFAKYGNARPVLPPAIVNSPSPTSAGEESLTQGIDEDDDDNGRQPADDAHDVDDAVGGDSAAKTIVKGPPSELLVADDPTVKAARAEGPLQHGRAVRQAWKRYLFQCQYIGHGCTDATAMNVDQYQKHRETNHRQSKELVCPLPKSDLTPLLTGGDSNTQASTMASTVACGVVLKKVESAMEHFFKHGISKTRAREIWAQATVTSGTGTSTQSVVLASRSVAVRPSFVPSFCIHEACSEVSIWLPDADRCAAHIQIVHKLKRDSTEWKQHFPTDATKIMAASDVLDDWTLPGGLSHKDVTKLVTDLAKVERKSRVGISKLSTELTRSSKVWKPVQAALDKIEAAVAWEPQLCGVPRCTSQGRTGKKLFQTRTLPVAWIRHGHGAALPTPHRRVAREGSRLRPGPSPSHYQRRCKRW